MNILSLRTLPILMVAMSVSASTAPAQSAAPVMESTIVAWTNLARHQYGKPSLAANDALTQAAQHHARNMAAKETMSHTLDGMTVADRVRAVGYNHAGVGENVAFNFGFANPGWQLFESWLTSPGHFQNIMNLDFTEIGVGVARSASGKYYACQVFGRPAPRIPNFAVPYSPYMGSQIWTVPRDSEDFVWYFTPVKRR